VPADFLRYSFCRTVDDLVDDAADDVEAQRNVTALFEYLRLAYKSEPAPPELQIYLKQFPPETHSAFSLLPSSRLPRQPLQDLLKGLESDLAFTRDKSQRWPIHDEKDLELYAFRVASTIAELCISLTYSHCRTTQSSADVEAIISSGRQMGLALQYINISRDIATDAQIGRVYLPTTWLQEYDLTPEMVLQNPDGSEIELLRQRLLSKAMKLYRQARPAIENLPPNARGPMRVAVESYVEIGRVLLKKGYRVKAGRATVPKIQRWRVAWKALSSG
jgi:15-cis-phytoene synthase/lycopene beta-cyclase